MKAMLAVVLLTLTCGVASADQLRLRDGKTIVGYYVGGNQKELWFQSNAIGADVYPTFVVESLQFGGVTTFPMGYVKPEGEKQQVAAGSFFSRTRSRLAKLYLSLLF